MQDFVEKYIEEQEAARRARQGERERHMSVESESTRDARLIRLGMCEKVYSESNIYSDEFPYEEFKTGKHYKLVPFAVTDEEYAAICRYDTAPVERKRRSLTARTFGNAARRIRRLSIFKILLGLAASIGLGVFIYLATDMDPAGLAVGLVALMIGVGFTWLDALTFYATGETLAAVEYLVDEADKRPHTEKE